MKERDKVKYYGKNYVIWRIEKDNPCYALVLTTNRGRYVNVPHNGLKEIVKR